MEQQLSEILIHTFHADKGLRVQAEKALEQFLGVNGALFALLSFVGNRELTRDLRQAAAIVVKNHIREFWRPDEKTETDNSIRGLIAETIRGICEFAYPDQWPALVPTLLTSIQNAGTNILQMYNALLAIRKLVKRYEYKQEEDEVKNPDGTVTKIYPRKPLNDIIQASFPLLQQLLTQILDNNQIEAAQVMRLCLKIFYSSTSYCLPKVQGVDVAFWFNTLGHIMQKALPESSTGLEPTGQPVSADDRKIWPWWKLKKWAGRIMCQFIQRYGNPRYCKESDQSFAQYFRSTLAGLLLPSIMTTLSTVAEGAYVTDEVHRFCLTFLSNCVEMSPTYKILKPNLNFLFFRVIFPILSLNKEELDLFTNDPTEFVRKQSDPMGEWVDPRVAGLNLLQTLARYRQKDTMAKVLAYMQQTLATYEATAFQSRDYASKDAVLVAFGGISKILQDSKQYKHLLEPFLVAHVIPEFQSPVPHIRYRACWIVEYFDEGQWKNPVTVQAVMHGLMQGLRDPSLSVQAAAACSIRHLMDAAGAVDIIRPHLSQIIGEYFRIMEETESDNILSSLQTIVEKFGSEIAPMATAMVTHLLRIFDEYFGLASADDDDEAAMNAAEALDTVVCVVDALDGKVEQLAEIEVLVLPILQRLLSNDDCFEYIDTALQLINYLTYYDTVITANMWTLCGPLLHALDNWAADYIREIMVPLINFMSKDIGAFLRGSFQDVPFVESLLKSCSKTFSLNQESTQDDKSAASLLTCLVLNSRQSQGIQTIIPHILQMIFSRLTPKGNRGLNIKLIETVLAVIYYDPNLAIGILNSQVGAADLFFDMLFNNLPCMETAASQRLIVLALSSIMSIPSTSLPLVAARNLPSLFLQIVKECTLLEEAVEYEDVDDDDDDEDDDEECGDDDEDDDGDDDIDIDGENEENDPRVKKGKAGGDRNPALQIPDGGYDEDEDCLNAESEDYRRVLEKLDEQKEVRRQAYMAGEPVDDEDDDEEYSYTSFVDEMDVVEFFLETMQSASQREPSLIAGLQTSLSGEDTSKLAQLVQAVAERKAAAATNK